MKQNFIWVLYSHTNRLTITNPLKSLVKFKRNTSKIFLKKPMKTYERYWSIYFLNIRLKLIRSDHMLIHEIYEYFYDKFITERDFLKFFLFKLYSCLAT